MVRSRAQPGPDVKPTGASHRCIISGSVCFLATSQEEHARNHPRLFFFFFFFPRAVLVFLGRQRIPHAPHFSLPHVFPAGMFKQEAPLSNAAPFPAPSPSLLPNPCPCRGGRHPSPYLHPTETRARGERLGFTHFS